VGVTTVVGVLAKPALIKWANNLGLQGIDSAKFVDDKADIGTLAHDMVMCRLLHQEVNMADYSENQIKQAEWAYDSFLNWSQEKDITVVESEKPLVSEKHGFGGQFDLYAMVCGSMELIDLKTSSGIYDEHKIQVAGGYKILLEENKYIIDRIRILNIPRTNNEHWGEVVIMPDQCKVFEDLFLACLKIYNLQKQLKGDVVYPKKHAKTKDLFEVQDEQKVEK
jgi:hypothetical protein